MTNQIFLAIIRPIQQGLLLLLIILFPHFSIGQDFNFTEVFPDILPPMVPNAPVLDGTMEFFDFDNDGNQDLLITGRLGSGVTHITELYSNDGNGNFFLIPETIFTSVIHGDIATADIDGDGDLDIVISGNGGTEFQNEHVCEMYLNDGTGSFSEVTDTPFPGVILSSMAFSDIDGDGDQDFMHTGYSENELIAELYLNDGQGNFTQIMETPFEGVSRSTILFEDLDGDNDFDVVLAGTSTDGGICRIYNNDGNGNFAELPDTPFDGLQFSSVSIVDMDGDGDYDLALNGVNELYFQKSYLYMNNGDNTYTLIEDSPLGMGQMVFTDLDGDSDQDVLVTGKEIMSGSNTRADVFINDGAGNFTLDASTELPPVGYSAMAISDVDNDNDQDLVVAGYSFGGNRCDLYFNDGVGNLSAASQAALTGLRYSAAAFADIDGDQDQDLLITGEFNGSAYTQLYVNEGDGFYELDENTPFESVMNGAVAFEDVDGDSDQDVIIGGFNGFTYTCEMYVNDGNGNYTLVPDTPFPGIRYGGIAFSDIDGDGDSDVLISGTSGFEESTCELFINDGTGNFVFIDSPFIDIDGGVELDFSVSTVLFVDIDGDGDEDALIAASFDYSITFTALYSNDGSGNFTYHSAPFESVLQGTYEFADIEGDGDLDVLITGYFSDGQEGYNNGLCDLYTNDGAGNFTVIDSPFEYLYGGSAAFADFDQDGDQDIVMGGSFEDDNGDSVPGSKLYTNDGLGVFSEIEVPFQGCSDGMIVVGDIDGDQDPDVLISGYSETGIETRLWRNSPCTTEGFENSTICHNGSIEVNGTIYDASHRQGAEFITGGAINGCDSVVIVYLDVLPPINLSANTDNLTITATSGYTSYQWLDCNDNYSPIEGATNFEFVSPANGNYAVEITDNDCMAISECFTTFDCTAEPAEGAIDSTICYTDSIIVNGNVYNASIPSGIEIFEGVTVNGCDSTVTINLNVLAQIDTSLVANETSLTAVTGYTNYQWVDCDDNFNPIEDANNPTFTAETSGNYAVEITFENCNSISSCVEIVMEEEPPAGVFPNPSEGGISIQFEEVHESLQVTVLTSFGAEVYNDIFYDTDLIQIELNQPAGIYIVEILDESETLYTYQFMII